MTGAVVAWRDGCMLNGRGTDEADLAVIIFGVYGSAGKRRLGLDVYSDNVG
jgi:hypothetical protein